MYHDGRCGVLWKGPVVSVTRGQESYNKNGSPEELPFGARITTQGLKAEVWPEGYTQIVLRSPGEIDGIAHFGSQSKWSPEALDANSGINREVSVAIVDCTHVTSK